MPGQLRWRSERFSLSARLAVPAAPALNFAFAFGPELDTGLHKQATDLAGTASAQDREIFKRGTGMVALDHVVTYSPP
jgi:hypothetical protein